MHFEILVEDISGKKALDILVPKIVGQEHTCRIISYKGIGHIPKKLNRESNPASRILLAQLPKLLKGYGRAHQEYLAQEYSAVVIVICDLDDKCLKEFRTELNQVLEFCDPKPNAFFCVAIEEGEAWFLGDIPAVKKAYPKAKDAVLKKYKNDSICRTWELLAEACCSGGSSSVSSKGYHVVGATKSEWAEKITPYMDIESNKSPSFCYFRDKLKQLAVVEES